MKKRFTEEQITGFLREVDAGVSLKDVCRKRGFSEASYYLWRNKFGGTDVSDAKRLKALEAESALEEAVGGVDVGERSHARGAAKKVGGVPARRELVRWMRSHGLSERRALQIIGMSVSSLRYQPAPDRNSELHERRVRLAQRHRRYGTGMIYLKLRQASHRVNHKRVDRLYALEKLQVRRRQRKKIPISERQLLERPSVANAVWSMDFVFDRVAVAVRSRISRSWTTPRTRRSPLFHSAASADISPFAPTMAKSFAVKRC